ncbi:MAG: DUF2281 domain-containing protein [Snowella sp.]|nr:DUF2281 domain-containing protein [Snowella sp.]
MNTKALLLQTLDELPEAISQEVLDFALFLRDKLEQKEDEEDLKDVEAALAEEGLISLADVKKELGL